ncbi:MAG: hypothetical protein CW341_09570 [Bacteroidetes bacterium]|nr:hypothetical protein [Bacteroidota bacterium]
MKNDAAIEDLFARYQPDLGDKDQYMEQLSKKLEAMEYAKQYREAQTKRYHRMMLAVFVSGVVTGFIGVMLVLFHPLWLFPAGTTIEVPMAFPLLPKVILMLAVCFASLCITGLVYNLLGRNKVLSRD